MSVGGFTDRDEQGLSYNVFNYMLGPLAIKSVLDLGCGKGFSTTEFLQRGARVLCVEGSHDAVQQSLLPPDMVVEHDFTRYVRMCVYMTTLLITMLLLFVHRGPWWPEQTFDATWSVEFFEHVRK